MLVTAVICMECGDTIYSRAQHDFRECTCGNSFIDGGLSYTRFGGTCSDPIQVEVTVTKEQLYEDWNKRIDKYGLIKGEK